ncbi:MAG: class I SAM-dependent methyltransferase [Anaerolineales bacterium]|nr:class I SAM-dependent methyltransferase [Anaerolineales bacterium]
MNANSDAAQHKRLVEQGYDQIAHDYARLETNNEWPRIRWLYKLLERLPPGSSVLDLGCGSGDPADIEIAQNHQITGVDISQTQIELARQNVPHGTFIHADAGAVDFPAASFDAVVSFYTIEHLPREEHASLLQRIQQWIKPNGFFLLSIEAGEYEGMVGEWLNVPMFISCFDPETMKGMVIAAGFNILETKIETQMEADNEVPFLWMLAQKR